MQLKTRSDAVQFLIGLVIPTIGMGVVIGPGGLFMSIGVWWTLGAIIDMPK